MASSAQSAEIAAVAARLVVEEGLEYGPAKRKAARGLGLAGTRGAALPDNETVEEHKTKSFAVIAEAFGWNGKTLIVESTAEKNLILSSRNVPGVTVASGVNVNIYDVLYHEKIVFTKDAINALQEKLSK